MPLQDGIVRPLANDRTPKLGSLAIIAAVGTDLQLLRRNLNMPDTRHIYLSGLYYNANDIKSPALVGPVMGAAYAVMVLETLRAWGVQTIVFVGWCGSISSHLRAGDILLPDSAVIDEGASLHYAQETGAIVHPHDNLSDTLGKALQKSNIVHSKGRVWSTDGIFRETPAKISKFQKQEALAVDMEFSALCSAARFYDISLSALLIVSDELFTLQWQPGFKGKIFKQARTAVCDFLTESYRGLGQ